MQSVSRPYVVEWKVSKPKNKAARKKITITWNSIFKFFIPVLLYSWISYSVFNFSIPIGKNFIEIQSDAGKTESEIVEMSFPSIQYWEIEDERANNFIARNLQVVQSLEAKNKIPAGVQMALGLLRIESFESNVNNEANLSNWKNRKRLLNKWKNQGSAISQIFLEKGQIPGSRAEWYQKIIEHFNEQYNDSGYLVQNLITLYDLKSLDRLEKS